MSDCLFCKIIEKKIPAKIEYEDPEFLAFYDIHPQAPSHLLIIPKKHIEQIGDLQDVDETLIGRLILRAKQIAKKNSWKDYRLVFNSGLEAGQTVFHIHLHLLSGRKMDWPPG
ncbi:MAG: histidine triad nucleotide-binding protein [Candidatus Omnitrophica bacterium]|nr:histidine triad nucleotide-binding protein [Candidatus Omnitrophota bacterium]